MFPGAKSYQLTPVRFPLHEFSGLSRKSAVVPKNHSVSEGLVPESKDVSVTILKIP